MFKGLFIISLLIIATMIFHLIRTRKVQNEIAKQLKRVNDDWSESIVEEEPLYVTEALTEQINTLIINLSDERKEYIINKDNMKKVVSAISHDFRTPLTSISGYVQVILDPQNTIDDETKLKYLNVIKSRSESLAVLVEDFYVNSCLESGEYPKRKTELSIFNVLRNSLVQYYKELEEKFEFVNINLPKERVEITADQAYLERIFSNLIKNAFTHGTIAFNVMGEIKNNMVKIIFANRLLKNADEKSFDVDKIFERNYSVDWSTGSVSTGLGMAIAKRLMEEMGYEIYAKAEDDELSFILEFSMEQ